VRIISRLAERKKAVERDELFALVARLYKGLLGTDLVPNALEFPPRAIASDDPTAAWIRRDGMTDYDSRGGRRSGDPAALGGAIVFAHNQAMLRVTDTKLLTYQNRKFTVWSSVSSEDRTYVSKSLFPHCLQAARKRLRETDGREFDEEWDVLVDLPGVTEAPYGPRVRCVNGLWLLTR
jgi:hypothetical protein